MIDGRERLEREGEGRGEGEVCAITVFYEDLALRDWVLDLLDHLLVEFRGQITFESSWWGFNYLSHADISHQAATAAANADVILVAVSPQRDVPLEVKAWFERWLSWRVPAEAAFGLLERHRQAESPLSAEPDYFQRFAQRAGLDFQRFSHDRTAVERGLAEFSSRLDSALWTQTIGDRYPSSGWGINE